MTKKKPSLIDYTNNGWEKIDIEKNLDKLAKACGGEKVTRYFEFKKGYLNKVFFVKISGKELVFKISPLWNNTGLAREYWCYKKLEKQKIGMEIPNILSYHPAKNEFFPGHEILIMEYVSGRPITKKDLAKGSIHKKLGLAIRGIHTISMERYGWLNKNFTGTHSSWKSFLQNIDNLEVTKKAGVLPQKDLKELIENLGKECPLDFKPNLLYGDLGETNIIINQKNEPVLVDFQNCFSGHNLYDLGIGLFFIPQIFDNLNHYTETKITEKKKKQIVLYAMRHAVSVLGHRILIKDKKKMVQAVKRFYTLKNLLISIS